MSGRPRRFENVSTAGTNDTESSDTVPRASCPQHADLYTYAISAFHAVPSNQSLGYKHTKVIVMAGLIQEHIPSSSSSVDSFVRRLDRLRPRVSNLALRLLAVHVLHHVLGNEIVRFEGKMAPL